MSRKPNYPTVTFNEVDEEVRTRMDSISAEFAKGFELIRTYTKSVTFFGSARFEEDNQYYNSARALAYYLGQEGFAVVTGGGPGIMEAGNRGAHDAGAQSIGFTIKLPHEQITNPYLTGRAGFHYFFTRKVCMTFATEAYICFPGGFGTMDEFFEILTLVQTGKIEKVPLVLFGSAFWKPIMDCVTATMLKNGTIDETDLAHFIITDDGREVLELVKAAPLRSTVPLPTGTHPAVDGVPKDKIKDAEVV